MAGWITNGAPLVTPGASNGVAATSPNGVLTNPGAAWLTTVDADGASGYSPQTVAMTLFQMASFAAEMISNTATSTVHAATLNTSGGLITTEALTTAAGATYTFTLTNSLLVAGAAAPQIVVRNGTNTGGNYVIASVTNATGSTVIVITNGGTTAYNGTILIAFHV